MVKLSFILKPYRHFTEGITSEFAHNIEKVQNIQNNLSHTVNTYRNNVQRTTMDIDTSLMYMHTTYNSINRIYKHIFIFDQLLYIANVQFFNIHGDSI